MVQLPQAALNGTTYEKQFGLSFVLPFWVVLRTI